MVDTEVQVYRRAEKPTRRRRLIVDLESDGLKHQLTKIHCIGLRDIDSKETFVYRNNDEMNNLEDSLEILNEADLLIAHNGSSFDFPVLWNIFGDKFHPTGKIRDSLVMTRMLFADEKERDFRRFRRKEIDGALIGNHGLKAWGQRLGVFKGDYADKKKEELKLQYPEADKETINRLVWAEWSQDMEDYMVGDLNSTEALWHKIEGVQWSEEAIVLEHRVDELMSRIEENGFPFDVEGGRILEDHLREQYDTKSKVAVEHFGEWWRPTKWIGPETKSYVSPLTGEKEKDLSNYRPRAEYGEDDTRVFWGEVQIPKRTNNPKEPTKGATEKGCAFCPVELNLFNPGSRTQITNRLQKMYGWEPQEFTEKGSPKIDDDILRDLSKSVPICLDLAEIFYYKKRLGQLIDGKNGLIGKAEERGDNKIHARINTGGTVTNRASHSNPNIAQVPRVVFKKRKLLGPDGEPILDEEGKPKFEDKKSLMKGREGDHGWDFRNLFHVPAGWKLMGADQKGIELRALGNFMWEFDNGAYARLVIEADPHELHQRAMELDSRDTSKTFVFAMVYGASDYKLGITIDPMLTLHPARAKALGLEMRRRLMTRIPALAQVIKSIQREAKRGFLIGMDGRRLFVRSPHAALNTKLQACAASLAKMWCILFEEMCEANGLHHGWNGDFVILTWIHDEIQVAVRDDTRIIEICRKNIIEAAAEAGRILDFKPMVDVDVKFGQTWADSH